MSSDNALYLEIDRLRSELDAAKFTIDSLRSELAFVRMSICKCGSPWYAEPNVVCPEYIGDGDEPCENCEHDKVCHDAVEKGGSMSEEIDITTRLRYWAHNEEMLDQYFTEHGKDCNEAVGAIDQLRTELAAAYDRLFALGAMNKPPCFRCGYNGAGYYQPQTHPCAAQHHAALDAAKEEGDE